MTNLIKALRTHIRSDSVVQSIVGDNVHFLRARNETATPMIIFTLGAERNEHEHRNGYHQYTVIIEVICAYERTWDHGMVLRNQLVTILNGAKQIDDYSCTVHWDRHSEVMYEDKTDRVALTSFYTIKNITS